MPKLSQEQQRSWVREDVDFLSGRERCAAWLYRPAQPCTNGVVVMAHGFGAPRRARLGVTAETLAAAGLPVLLFDYRHLGTSEGMPRQLVDIPKHLEDWRSAVAYIRGLNWADPDRIALFGTSFGGGLALISAAEDQRIAALVAQTPFLDGRAGNEHRPRGFALAALLLAAWCDQVAGWLRLPPVNIPICAAQGGIGVLTTPDALHGFRLLDTDGTGLNYTPARAILQMHNHRPALRARDVRCPVLYFLCLEDTLAPHRVAMRAIDATPNAEVHTYSGGHFDVYETDGGAIFRQATDAQIAFLQRHLR